jgi:c-di-GMP-binding flagellar brake protein YcgR
MDKYSNRRKFFRVQLEVPLCSDISIVKINDRPIDSSSTKICVSDLSAGGLLFNSNLNFPVDESILFEFHTKLLDVNLKVLGKIVRKQEWKEGIFQYGVSFVIHDMEREPLIKLLNNLSIKLRNRGRLSNTSVCSKRDIIKCLRER